MIVTPFQRLTCPPGLRGRLQPGGSTTESNKVEQNPMLPGPIDASVKNRSKRTPAFPTVIVWHSPQSSGSLVRGSPAHGRSVGTIQPSGGPFEGSPVPHRRRWYSTKPTQPAFELSPAGAPAKLSSNAHQAIKLATSATVAQSCFANNLIRCKGYQLSNEKYQSGNENRTLSEAIPRQRIKQYMQERHKWDKETFDKVNLDAYAAARRSNRRLERFSSRFAHGWLPTRKRMRIIGTAGNDECIWCHDTETQDHLFQCPHQSAWRDEFIERLDKYLTDSATEPTVKEEVLECTTSWLNQSTCPCKCDQLRIG
jgi:hypothetical protein